MVAQEGLAALSTRDLARAIGKSTMVIFSQFESKAGLLAAMLKDALAADTAFHAGFRSEARRLPLTPSVLSDIAGRYLLARADPAFTAGRMWLECLLQPDPTPEVRSLLDQWLDMRRCAWADILAPDPRLAVLEPVCLPYLVMEEFYAAALGSRLGYEVLMREGLASLAAHAAGGHDGAAPVAEQITAGLIPPEPPALRHAQEPIRLRLLDIASDQILARGLAAVTNRSVAAEAQTSPSTILYHFGDMRRFLVEAIWHSVFRRIPAYLDWRRPAEGERPRNLDA